MRFIHMLVGTYIDALVQAEDMFAELRAELGL